MKRIWFGAHIKLYFRTFSSLPSLRWCHGISGVCVCVSGCLSLCACYDHSESSYESRVCANTHTHTLCGLTQTLGIDVGVWLAFLCVIEYTAYTGSGCLAAGCVTCRQQAWRERKQLE